MAFGTVLRQSYLAKMYFVGKKIILERNQCGSGSETLLFSIQICGYAISLYAKKFACPPLLNRQPQDYICHWVYRTLPTDV